MKKKLYKIVGLNSSMKEMGHFGYGLSLQEAKQRMEKINPPKFIKGLTIKQIKY